MMKFKLKSFNTVIYDEEKIKEQKKKELEEFLKS